MRVITLICLILLTNASDNTHNSLQSRHKRHSLKHGRCDPLLTFLGQGEKVLHEIPIRREKFFFRPRSTFTSVVLELRLDNSFTTKDPKIYGPRVEFQYNELKDINYTDNSWIEVVAEAFKDKSIWLDYWRIRLTVNGEWKRDVQVKKWWKIYLFDALVISGEGGAEWSFDCYPDFTVVNAESHKSLQEIELTDDNVWMATALIVAALLLVVVVGCSVVYCRRKQQPPPMLKAFMAQSTVRITYK